MLDSLHYKNIKNVQSPKTLVNYVESGQYGYSEELARIEEMISNFVQIEFILDDSKFGEIHDILECINSELENISGNVLLKILNIQEYFQKCLQIIIKCTLNNIYPIVCDTLNSLSCFISKCPELSKYLEPYEEPISKKKDFINDDDQPFEIKEDNESGIYALNLVLKDTENNDTVPFLVRFDLLTKIIVDSCKYKPFAISFGTDFFEFFLHVIVTECSNNNFETLSFYINVLNYIQELYDHKNCFNSAQIDMAIEAFTLFLEKFTIDNIEMMNIIYHFFTSLLEDINMIFSLYSHNTYEILFSKSFDEVFCPQLVHFLNTSLSIEDSNCPKLHEILTNEVSSKLNIGDFVNIANENHGCTELVDDVISLVFNKIVTDDSIESFPLTDIFNLCNNVIQESPLDEKNSATELYIEILKYLTGPDFSSFYSQDLFTIILEDVATINNSNIEMILKFLINYHEKLFQQTQFDQTILINFLNEIEENETDFDNEISIIRSYFDQESQQHE